MKEELPYFLMLIGAPGSGKSSWVNKNIDPENVNIISTDLIRKKITGDISDISEDNKVWAIAKKRTIKALENKENAILDATNVNPIYRKSFIKELPSCNLLAKRFEVEPNVAKQRIKRALKEGEDRSKVPEKVINQMHLQFTRLSKPEQLEDEGFTLIESPKDLDSK